MDDMVISLIGLVLASSVLSAVINQIGESIRQKKKHDFDTEDEKDKDIKALKNGLKWVLYDRIRHLCLVYIQNGEVAVDDRRILCEMHTSYHDGLDGNGDLDRLMSSVYELPLKG